MNFIARNYAVLLFTAASLLLIISVGYAMFSTFGWYTLIFFAIQGWTSYVLATGFTNFTLN